ncbi:MAG: hdrA, partial [candidate division NC10 bacterium]|nr:hdrA [candidate division NC10 bacterium]
MARTGVFVCWCGSNIAKTVDVERVAAEAGTLPGVVHAAHYKYMCSEPGQALVRQAIAEHRLDRIVVAACSPRLHEPTFRKCIAQTGLNPFMAEMANIREHCSWVHGDRDTATAKAIDLTRMAAARIRRNEPLSQTEIPITKKALVVGGGIAGIQAALDIAEAGYQVTLVERTPSIGGRMAQFDKTFPTLDCAACILTPKMVECAS